MEKYEINWEAAWEWTVYLFKMGINWLWVLSVAVGVAGFIWWAVEKLFY